jgi:hypothetical protein
MEKDALIQMVASIGQIVIVARQVVAGSGNMVTSSWSDGCYYWFDGMGF